MPSHILQGLGPHFNLLHQQNIIQSIRLPSPEHQGCCLPSRHGVFNFRQRMMHFPRFRTRNRIQLNNCTHYCLQCEPRQATSSSRSSKKCLQRFADLDTGRLQAARVADCHLQSQGFLGTDDCLLRQSGKLRILFASTKMTDNVIEGVIPGLVRRHAPPDADNCCKC